MIKCKKVKNPCKICLGPVTRKAGLQCQGACKCWVHYNCLNYTPGKIKDIKAGIIKVTCPCPNCKSTFPKEIRTDEPYNCNNAECPANQPPRCKNMACPIYMDGPPDNMKQAAVANASPVTTSGAECKEHSYSNAAQAPGPPKSELYRPHSSVTAPRLQRQNIPSDSRVGVPQCSSRCCLLTDIPGDHGQCPIEGLSSLSTLEQICNTVGQLTNQINSLMNKIRQAVQSNGSVECGVNNRRDDSQKAAKSLYPKSCCYPGNSEREN